jgi:hypothetical protein
VLVRLVTWSFVLQDGDNRLLRYVVYLSDRLHGMAPQKVKSIGSNSIPRILTCTENTV